MAHALIFIYPKTAVIRSTSFPSGVPLKHSQRCSALYHFQAVFRSNIHGTAPLYKIPKRCSAQTFTAVLRSISLPSGSAQTFPAMLRSTSFPCGVPLKHSQRCSAQTFLAAPYGPYGPYGLAHAWSTVLRSSIIYIYIYIYTFIYKCIDMYIYIYIYIYIRDEPP
jgi:hypothetical protein